MTKNIVNLIRLADHDDIENITGLHTVVLNEYYQELSMLGVYRDSNTDFWRSRINAEFATTFIAYSTEGKAVGFGSSANIIQDEDVVSGFDGYIEFLYVRDLSFNLDLLRRILSILAIDFLGQQKHSAFIWFLSSNKRMRYFCHSTGAVEIDKKKKLIQRKEFNFIAFGWKDLFSLIKYN